MTPLRVETLGVEPVSVAEMRAALRIEPDDTGEDPLLAGLVTAARAAVETATRRLLVRARFRVMLTAWPRGGVLPLPLSPLVGIVRAGTVDADGTVTDLAAGRVRPGPDPWEAPCLLFGDGLPALVHRAALIEVSAGCGGDGPPVPEPLAQAVRMTAVHWFENRGDTPGAGLPGTGLPEAAAALLAPHRLLRL